MQMPTRAGCVRICTRDTHIMKEEDDLGNDHHGLRRRSSTTIVVSLTRRQDNHTNLTRIAKEMSAEFRVRNTRQYV